jgi:hypothetical protein
MKTDLQNKDNNETTFAAVLISCRATLTDFQSREIRKKPAVFWVGGGGGSPGVLRKDRRDK